MMTCSHPNGYSATLWDDHSITVKKGEEVVRFHKDADLFANVIASCVTTVPVNGKVYEYPKGFRMSADNIDPKRGIHWVLADKDQLYVLLDMFPSFLKTADDMSKKLTKHIKDSMNNQSGQSE